MADFFREHPKSKWATIILASLIVGIIIASALFDWNLLRGPLARTVTRQTGRTTTINGDIRVHLWSFHPSVQIGGLQIDNPGWADRKIMFGARDIIVSVSVGRLLMGQVVLPLLEIDGPEINLERDAKSRASWELGTKSGIPNHRSTPAKLPAINRLVIKDGTLHVVDQIRKLTFSGSLNAGEQKGRDDSTAFRIRATGSLNAKPFRLDADGGPLLDLTPTKPYSFSAHLTASDINLETEVTVRKPFDLDALDVKFVVSGDDLADVFYLTGLALPNTPKYKLAATLHINGSTVEIPNLHGSLGTSDLSGTMQIDTGGDKPKLTAHLTSEVLDLADLAPTLGQRVPPPNRLSQDNTSGAKSHGKQPNSSAKPASPPAQDTAQNPKPPEANNGLLLPDADLQVDRVRGMDADVTYRANSVKVPKIPMKGFDLHVVLAGGLLTIDPLNFDLTQGKLAGRVQIDARRDDPSTDVDLHIDNVNLDEFKSATMKEAPLGGVMLGHLEFKGVGSSVHKFAAASNGAMSVVIPQGNINEAIAELTGINVLQGLGLLITKEQKKTDIRCSILDFKDHDGTLNTTTVYVDTSNVLITGRGDINMRDEDIKLSLQGDPKHIRLIRLRSPIVVGGTLLHPTIGLNAGKLAEQAGIAAALGTLLTPAAAALAFVDPGLAKNKDCSTVLAQAQAGVQNP
jgi:uncharacterized protein involved in outer membrane biogenesis